MLTPTLTWCQTHSPDVIISFVTPKIRLKLAKRLKALRARFGLTQESLSEKSDVAYKHIQRLESKAPNAAKIDTLDKLASAFGITCSELLKFKDQ